MYSHFAGVFWATAAAVVLLFLSLLAASATIGQLEKAWRSYTMSFVFIGIAMAIIYIYHAWFSAAKTSPILLTWYMAIAAIALLRAAQHLRKAWQVPC